MLARLVARVRDRAERRMWIKLSEAVGPAECTRLEGLLIAPEGERRTHLDRLRRSPTRVSAPSMVGALERYAEVKALGVSEVDLSAVPPGRIKALCRYAATAWAARGARGVVGHGSGARSGVRGDALRGRFGAGAVRGARSVKMRRRADAPPRPVVCPRGSGKAPSSPLGAVPRLPSSRAPTSLPSDYIRGPALCARRHLRVVHREGLTHPCGQVPPDRGRPQNALPPTCCYYIQNGYVR